VAFSACLLVATLLLQSSAGGLLEAPAVLVNPRRAFAFGAVVVCGLLLLQYAHRRKLFILLWAAGWLLIAPAMLVVSGAYTNAIVARVAIGVSQFLGICTAALFFWSADVFRQTGVVRTDRLKPLMALSGWFVLAPLLLGPASVVVPGNLLSALILGAAAAMYGALVLERRMIGAGLVAFVLIGIAASNLSSLFLLQRSESGSELLEILTVKAVLYTFGALGMHLLIFEDMTYELRMTNRRLETAREELLQASITDPLTGCHNRRFLDQVMDRELQRHTRFKLPMSLLFIDVNRFKAINDLLGHEAGDRVLQYVARFLKSHIREADYVFRYGGDEFLVLITCTGEEARQKGDALKATFDLEPDTSNLPPGIGLSVGTIEVPLGTTDLTPLIHEVDKRMYEDKGTAARPAKKGSRAARR
jgi:diguanylate cyclase (GGDEF)-like protein